MEKVVNKLMGNMKRMALFICLALLISFCLDSQLYAQDQENIAKGLLDGFTSRTEGWWSVLQSKAFGIFKIVLIIDVCLFGFRMAVKRHAILTQ